LAWVDPRTFPQPPFQGKRPPLAKCSDEVEPLIKLCESGSIYAVERWIQDGKPLQWAASEMRYPFGPTALTTALEREIDDLALLLLCNGYNPNIDGWSPFDHALAAQQRGRQLPTERFPGPELEAEPSECPQREGGGHD
jgi:hypothetical protein